MFLFLKGLIKRRKKNEVDGVVCGDGFFGAAEYESAGVVVVEGDVLCEAEGDEYGVAEVVIDAEGVIEGEAEMAIRRIPSCFSIGEIISRPAPSFTFSSFTSLACCCCNCSFLADFRRPK